MFLNELSPLVRELAQQPVAFLGGFVSGLLRLDLGEDPVRSWLDRQATAYTGTSASASGQGAHNGKAQGPQTISID
jgi:hypothetical protein